VPYVGTGLPDSAALFRRASPEASVGVATATSMTSPLDWLR